MGYGTLTRWPPEQRPPPALKQAFKEIRLINQKGWEADIFRKKRFWHDRGQMRDTYYALLTLSGMRASGMDRMKLTVSIDVPSIEEGLKFFGGVFGFVETSRPHPGYAMLTSGDATIGLLAKPAGSSPAPGSNDIRRYERHWTPVHVDFRVDDFEETLRRALENGATSEQVHRMPGFPPVAFCSDPFGHGFCIVGLNKL